MFVARMFVAEDDMRALRLALSATPPEQRRRAVFLAADVAIVSLVASVCALPVGFLVGSLSLATMTNVVIDGWLMLAVHGAPLGLLLPVLVYAIGRHLERQVLRRALAAPASVCSVGGSAAPVAVSVHAHELRSASRERASAARPVPKS